MAVGESSLRHLIDQGYKLTGVIHVGANDGEEVPYYFEQGATTVVCFEPHPAAVARARAKFGDREGLHYIAAGLGSEQGFAEFLVPGDADDEKTSLRKPIPTEGHDWTKVPTGASILAPIFPFKKWLAFSRFDLTMFNAVVIDAQGMELEVLHGFGNLLQGFEMLCIELSEKPVYEGEASAQDVIDYVSIFGFKPQTEVQEHGDVLFTREAS